MKVKPLGDRLLVKVLQVEEKTKGGIYIPQTAQEKTQQGIVEEIGDPDLVKVKVGQKVIYDKYAGTQIKIDEVEYLILKNDDVLAVVED
ncbi:MAG: co-chaperone GroES [Spirochaetia bacterium]|nr:co-chaperone GroES [Spirochaetota bacterium]MCX8097002.1 co-chaperone GroES [Spirochaetota bacterium]MDW8111915.1 co-chaperone GroES [Spirochaetia bacterium]